MKRNMVHSMVRLLVVGACAGGGCGSGEMALPAPSGAAPKESGLSLEILDVATHAPLAGANVRIGQTQATSDAAGHVILGDLPSGEMVVELRAAGYVHSSMRAKIASGVHARQPIFMKKLGKAMPFDAAVGGTFEAGGVKVELPPDGIVDAEGDPVAGMAAITITPFDPMTEDAKALPGTLEGIPLGEEKRVLIQSAYMADVSLWRGEERLQLAKNKKARLTLPMPERLKDVHSPGKEVGRWWFDPEAAFWREEGSGLVTISDANNASSWTTEVSHFTLYNCDWPAPMDACVHVVVTANGLPAPGVMIDAAGSGPGFGWGHSMGSTEPDGSLVLPVPAGFTMGVEIMAGPFPPSPMEIVTALADEPCAEVRFDLSIGACLPGELRPCMTDLLLGECRPGIQACEGMDWGSCMGAIGPSPEICNGLDDDCNGLVDENACALPVPPIALPMPAEPLP